MNSYYIPTKMYKGLRSHFTAGIFLIRHLRGRNIKIIIICTDIANINIKKGNSYSFVKSWFCKNYRLWNCQQVQGPPCHQPCGWSNSANSTGAGILVLHLLLSPINLNYCLAHSRHSITMYWMDVLIYRLINRELDRHGNWKIKF